MTFKYLIISLAKAMVLGATITALCTTLYLLDVVINGVRYE